MRGIWPVSNPMKRNNYYKAYYWSKVASNPLKMKGRAKRALEYYHEHKSDPKFMVKRRAGLQMQADKQKARRKKVRAERVK